MQIPDPSGAAPTGRAACASDHAVPAFRSTASHWHYRRKVSRIRLEAEWLSLRYAAALRGARTFVQFAGWPRSGHSLVGALIDAHPQAVIAHELDAMGLFRKGVPARRLPALCLANAAAFTRAGRHWNGFCYAVPGAAHGPGRGLRVVGDKKGDWATRWSAADSSLATRLAAASRLECRWILVTRHPADNIATMTLRQGRNYDRLRISEREDVARAIRSAQTGGEIPDQADDAMIADYRSLAAATAALKARVPPENWHEIAYERFTSAPGETLDGLAAFLGLDPEPAWRDAAAGIVQSSGRRSRNQVSWRPDQCARIAETISAFDFLSVYAGES